MDESVHGREHVGRDPLQVLLFVCFRVGPHGIVNGNMVPPPALPGRYAGEDRDTGMPGK